jgi:hypothetical protein
MPRTWNQSWSADADAPASAEAFAMFYNAVEERRAAAQGGRQPVFLTPAHFSGHPIPTEWWGLVFGSGGIQQILPYFVDSENPLSADQSHFLCLSEADPQEQFYREYPLEIWTFTQTANEGDIARFCWFDHTHSDGTARTSPAGTEWASGKLFQRVDGQWVLYDQPGTPTRKTGYGWPESGDYITPRWIQSLHDLLNRMIWTFGATTYLGDELLPYHTYNSNLMLSFFEDGFYDDRYSSLELPQQAWHIGAKSSDSSSAGADGEASDKWDAAWDGLADGVYDGTGWWLDGWSSNFYAWMAHDIYNAIGGGYRYEAQAQRSEGLVGAKFVNAPCTVVRRLEAYARAEVIDDESGQEVFSAQGTDMLEGKYVAVGTPVDKAFSTLDGGVYGQATVAFRFRYTAMPTAAWPEAPSGEDASHYVEGFSTADYAIIAKWNVEGGFTYCGDRLTALPPINLGPLCNAGVDQQGQGPTFLLDGTVTDQDELPEGRTLTQTWTLEDGPAGGSATFGDASAVDTTVRLYMPGTYTLRLTASDSELTAWDEMQILVSSEWWDFVQYADRIDPLPVVTMRIVGQGVDLEIELTWQNTAGTYFWYSTSVTDNSGGQYGPMGMITAKVKPNTYEVDDPHLWVLDWLFEAYGSNPNNTESWYLGITNPTTYVEGEVVKCYDDGNGGIYGTWLAEFHYKPDGQDWQHIGPVAVTVSVE